METLTLSADKSAAMPVDMSMPSSASDLLQPKIGYRNWAIDLAEKKLFYVRGLTQFRGFVLSDVSKIAGYIQPMKERLKLLGNWGMPSLASWETDFSPRQIYAVVGKSPVSFYKAAQIVLLCAVVAENVKSEISAADVFQRMKIVPALSYIYGFNSEKLDVIKKLDPNFLDLMRKETGQETVAVFEDMAKGHRVSQALAQRVQRLLRENFPDLGIGEVEAFVPNHRIKLSPHETLDDKLGWELWKDN